VSEAGTLSIAEPWQDMRGAGTARSEPWLSLEDDAQAVRRALAVAAYNVHRACLVGNPAPIVRRMYERLSNPRVGDLVVETSSVMYRCAHLKPGGPGGDWYRGVGYLLAHRTEWWHTDADWRQALGAGEWGSEDPRPTDRAWYVQYGPEPHDVCRWVNCDFVVVPVEVLADS
jgi:hypothetical protein